MDFEAALVELHRIFRQQQQTIADLRALAADYEALLEDKPNMALSYETIRWNFRRQELHERYTTLTKGENT